MIKKIFLSSLFLFLLPAISTAGEEEDFLKLKSSYESLKTGEVSTDKARALIKSFEDYSVNYQESESLSKVYFILGKLYGTLYRTSREEILLDKSLLNYEKVFTDYPYDDLAPQSIFISAEMFLLKKRNGVKAYSSYKNLVQKYPDSEFSKKAMARLENLKGFEEPQKEPVKTETANVSGIRYWSNDDYTRVVVDLSTPSKYKSTMLPGDAEKKLPPRLYLDISQSRLATPKKEPIPIHDTHLKQVRFAQNTLDTVRLVLDIEHIDSYKIFSMDDPFRIVIDMRGKALKEETVVAKNNEMPESPKTEKQPAPKEEKKKEAEESPKPSKPEEEIKNGATQPKLAEEEKKKNQPSIAHQLGLEVKTVVIDAGHGGKDSGAIGFRGLKEKDVVLKIAKRLKEILVKDYGLEVIMTRESDVFIPLEERTAIANTKKADLFISVHANASHNKNAKGIETYYLNLTNDENSIDVAARENATSSKKISDLQAILQDLLLNSKINESSRLAENIQNSLVTKLLKNFEGVKNLGVKQAPFYVLVGAEMPSVLVETSFITNNDDGKRLKDKKYLEEVSQSIAVGIKTYITAIKVANY